MSTPQPPAPKRRSPFPRGGLRAVQQNSPLFRGQIFRRHLAGLRISNGLVRQRLAVPETGQSRPLHCGFALVKHHLVC